MEITFLLKGLIIGFAMAIPIGPIGVLCIRKTLTNGQLRGMIIGFGAATADMLFSCVAAFSLTYIADLISSNKTWLRIVGGALLLYIGIKTFLAKPADPNTPTENGGIWRSYLSTLFLTITNPMTIFAFIAVFAALRLDNGLTYLSATLLVLGVFAGSSSWFLLLSYCVKLFRSKLNTKGLQWVNRIAGLLIIISVGIALGSLVFLIFIINSSYKALRLNAF